MTELKDELEKLVLANRILAREGVMDVYGHVSIRHPHNPDRFFQSCSRSPELVSYADLIEFALDCAPIDQRDRPLYGERPIHGAVYSARPDVHAVIHNHTPELLPYTVSPNFKLRPLIHSGACIGCEVPIWDIRSKFGDTNMLVLNMDQGRDLAATLGSNTVVLMRGHGSTVVGASIERAVMAAVYLKLNAKIQATASRFGEPEFLTPGEISRTQDIFFSEVSVNRAWEYWSSRARSPRSAALP
jgi:ribulose-5-phosphate 4-epimerase/fuculose-1-phosphate aldolase